MRFHCSGMTLRQGKGRFCHSRRAASPILSYLKSGSVSSRTRLQGRQKQFNCRIALTTVASVVSVPVGIVTTRYISTMRTHVKARCDVYPHSSTKRFPVSDDKVHWEQDFCGYAPVEYTDEVVTKRPVWADVPREELKSHPIKFNGLDGVINRRSHHGDYKIVDDLPRNPVGRTGITGRGLLGRWGPNHAADPIVTKWKMDKNGKQVMKDGKPVLQFIAVERRDNGQWAIPGGMVNAGEVVTITIRREFAEESMNSLEATPEEKKVIEAAVDELFAHGVEVYRGYVDDPRNTDNAWMETVAMNFHDKDGSSVAKFKLHAGDDAVGVKWIDLSSNLELFASHIDFLQTTAQKHGANW